LEKCEKLILKWGNLEETEKAKHLKELLQAEIDDESEIEKDVMSDEFRSEIIMVCLEPILSVVGDSLFESKLLCLKSRNKQNKIIKIT
jgi:hypothetical protein